MLLKVNSLRLPSCTGCADAITSDEAVQNDWTLVSTMLSYWQDGRVLRQGAINTKVSFATAWKRRMLTWRILQIHIRGVRWCTSDNSEVNDLCVRTCFIAQ